MPLSKDLLRAAAQLVTSRNEPTISLLQRHFRIGYGLAGQVLNHLEQEGVVVTGEDGIRRIAPAHSTAPDTAGHAEAAAMKYQPAIDRIRSGLLSKQELRQFRENAVQRIQQGDRGAQAVVTAIDGAVALDRDIIFMGFCPDADFDNRLDIEWKAQGICTFHHMDSAHQLQRFNSIWPGDLIVLKKRQEIGRTMQLYGHGRVKGVKYTSDHVRYLEVDWASQDSVVEVPLMSNSTIDIKSSEQVREKMPALFYRWLGHQVPPEAQDAVQAP
ncbi:DNA translocase FtsK [Acidovorax sp. A1169]|uniref:DNA translocase FtsK n=1 Tax=Acidovorax sp. A1169 TaxID=3059524 RepID=UPI00273792C5|nr:DNA translocase FtsK [Acidovorax sp. A1169]MDP4077892.1 DNA translocase FtsK [Acidovorax sp. A1169]